MRPHLLSLLLFTACASADGGRTPDQPALRLAGREQRVDTRGVTLATEGSAGLPVRLRAWGRETEMRPAAPAQPRWSGCPDTPRVACAGGSLRYDRDGIVEWWIARGQGLEQGFTLHDAPSGHGPLRLDIDLEGAADLVVHNGVARLEDASGQAWQIGSFSAWDADDQPLEVGVEPRVGGLALRVELSGARYPITIDPIYTSADTTLTGAQVGEGLGRAVDGAGDLDGDGYDDVIIGSPLYDDGSVVGVGLAAVYLGSASGLDTTPTTTVMGVQATGLLGDTVCGAGDLNGDGYGDVAIGAFGELGYTGAVRIYEGGASGLSATAVVLAGENSGAMFGDALSGAGDIDGDGYDDLMVGAVGGTGTYVGAAYLYLGGSAGVDTTADLEFLGTTTWGSYGSMVAGAGDVNGDGYDDVLIAAAGSDEVYLHHGTAGGLLFEPLMTLESAASGADFGTSGDGAGDLDADGYDDVVIGDPGASSGDGAAYVFQGNSDGLDTSAVTTLTGTGAGYFGYDVDGAGDVDADGYPDVLVGEPGTMCVGGEATIYFGGSAGLATTASRVYIGSDGCYGMHLAGAGDVNGDATDDFVVGAYSMSSTTGEAYIYEGFATEESGEDDTAADDSGADDSAAGDDSAVGDDSASPTDDSASPDDDTANPSDDSATTDTHPDSPAAETGGDPSEKAPTCGCAGSPAQPEHLLLALAAALALGRRRRPEA